MAGSKISVTIEGVEYPSRTHAAKALVASGKTLKETTDALNKDGMQMTYQTVYAVTKGAEKVAVRRVKYRVLNLGRSGRRTAGEIAKKVGVSTSKVVAMLKKENIAIVTKEARDKAKAESKAPKTPVVETPAPVVEPEVELEAELVEAIETVAATADEIVEAGCTTHATSNTES